MSGTNDVYQFTNTTSTTINWTGTSGSSCWYIIIDDTPDPLAKMREQFEELSKNFFEERDSDIPEVNMWNDATRVHDDERIAALMQ